MNNETPEQDRLESDLRFVCSRHGQQMLEGVDAICSIELDYSGIVLKCGCVWEFTHGAVIYEGNHKEGTVSFDPPF